MSKDKEEVDASSNKSDRSRGPSSKKRRLYKEDMLWHKQELIARQSANPSCQATQKILGTFGSDFTGTAVNINNVFSSLHHIAPVKENTGRVGSTEISLGHSKPAQRVRTNGDWTSVFYKIAKATMFVFPHRK
ncbi:hypothetical protein B0H34DRAFT_801947 [Crassisporium funariophilum]|nr:hypothetical protein B0H34DRAFT_801947 [Crassisporium funariophilum]